MDRVYQSNAVEIPPSVTAPSGSFPTAGNKTSGQAATVPGAYWFYSVTEELRNALVKMGIAPDSANVSQLAEALGKLLPLSGGAVTGTIVSTVINPLSRDTDNSYLQIRSAPTRSGGASVELRGINDGTGNKGGFVIRATNGTVNKDLKGLPGGELEWDGMNVICVDSWSSGSSWYRKYSDGWIEQGGEIQEEDNWVNRERTISLNVPFKNTDYIVTFGDIMRKGDNYMGEGNSGIKSKTTSNLVVWLDDMTGGVNWHACGY